MSHLFDFPTELNHNMHLRWSPEAREPIRRLLEEISLLPRSAPITFLSLVVRLIALAAIWYHLRNPFS